MRREDMSVKELSVCVCLSGVPHHRLIDLRTSQPMPLEVYLSLSLTAISLSLNPSFQATGCLSIPTLPKHPYWCILIPSGRPPLSALGFSIFFVVCYSYNQPFCSVSPSSSSIQEFPVEWFLHYKEVPVMCCLFFGHYSGHFTAGRNKLLSQDGRFSRGPEGRRAAPLVRWKVAERSQLRPQSDVRVLDLVPDSHENR